MISSLVGAWAMTCPKSGTTSKAQISGKTSIATEACTIHQASQARGLIYFMPRPNVP